MLGGAAVAWPLATGTVVAQPDRIRRIAFLSGLAASDHEAQARLSALQQSLNKLGWVEGRNLRLDVRWGIGERDQMQELASELVELKLRSFWE